MPCPGSLEIKPTSRDRKVKSLTIKKSSALEPILALHTHNKKRGLASCRTYSTLDFNVATIPAIVSHISSGAVNNLTWTFNSWQVTAPGHVNPPQGFTYSVAAASTIQKYVLSYVRRLQDAGFSVTEQQIAAAQEVLAGAP